MSNLSFIFDIEIYRDDHVASWEFYKYLMLISGLRDNMKWCLSAEEPILKAIDYLKFKILTKIEKKATKHIPYASTIESLIYVQV